MDKSSISDRPPAIADTPLEADQSREMEDNKYRGFGEVSSVAIIWENIGENSAGTSRLIQSVKGGNPIFNLDKTVMVKMEAGIKERAI